MSSGKLRPFCLGLSVLSARPSPGNVMTKFGFSIHGTSSWRAELHGRNKIMWRNISYEPLPPTCEWCLSRGDAPTPTPAEPHRIGYNSHQNILICWYNSAGRYSLHNSVQSLISSQGRSNHRDSWTHFHRPLFNTMMPPYHHSNGLVLGRHNSIVC